MILTEDDEPKLGLRERKKAKTRAAIQQHALRLFRDQGYHATTVEQIAEAAEISPSTFFRYFPTKEDVVLNDEYDARFMEAFHAQPAQLPPLQALRQAMKLTVTKMTAEERSSELDRGRLILEVPEVRAAFLNRVAKELHTLSEEVAKRVGRHADDIAVLTFTGAIFGVGMSVTFRWMENPDTDFYSLVDEALAHLEAGLPL